LYEVRRVRVRLSREEYEEEIGTIACCRASSSGWSASWPAANDVSVISLHYLPKRKRSSNHRRTSQFSRTDDSSLVQHLNFPQLALELSDFVLGFEDECDLCLRGVGFSFARGRKGDGRDGEERGIELVCEGMELSPRTGR
jgi:hypothetical protein